MKSILFLFLFIFPSLLFCQNSGNPFIGEWQYVTEDVHGNDTVHFPLYIVYKFSKDGKLELQGKMIKPSDKSWIYKVEGDSLFVNNKNESISIHYSIVDKNIIRLHHINKNQIINYLFIRNNSDGLKILKKFETE